MEILFSFAVILILVLLNGMFVAAEFAIIGVRPTRIDQLAEEGSPIAKRLRYILHNPAQVDRYIASAQLGITLASLGLGMYAEPAIAHLIEKPLHDQFHLEGAIVHTISFFIALGIITYLHVVIGEMVPKSLALQNAERTVFLLATPMLMMQTIFSYPITFLNRIGVLTLRLMGVAPPIEGSRLHTPDELELIISESVVGGLVEAEEQRLIHNIFDFTELHVSQVMTPRPRIEAIPITISEADLLTLMVTSPHSRLPVYEDTIDHIIGVVHLKDLIHQQVRQTTYDLRQLIHQVPFVPEGLQADQLLTRFKAERVHMAIVVDEYGGTAGLVTLEDLIEEVMGDVRDEFDTEEQSDITVVAPGHLLVLGDTRLDEIAEYTPLGKIEEDVESIGGLLLARLPLPPPVGASIEVNGVTLRVEAVDGMTIEKASVRYNPANPPLSDKANKE